MVARTMMNKMVTITMNKMMTIMMTIIMMTIKTTLKTTPAKQNKAKGCVPLFESQAWHEPAIKI